MPLTVKPILDFVLLEYALHPRGVHGVAHWARVLENGIRLAAETGANVDVVKLFAVLHDSRRLNDYDDPDHGPRAARLARQMRDKWIALPDHEFGLLCRACEGHTHERTHPDVTIQTCWDADRLDLGRVGTTPHASRLCTDFAKLPETIRWSDRRATTDFVPTFVRDEWRIDHA